MPRLSGSRSDRPPDSLPSAPCGAQSDPLPTDPPGAAPSSRRRESGSVDRHPHRGRAGRFLSACLRRAAAALLSGGAARPGARRRAFAGVLASVLFGFAALLAVPQTAHAQAVKEIWSATLTTGASSTAPTMFGYAFYGSGATFGSLSANSISDLGSNRSSSALFSNNASGGTLNFAASNVDPDPLEHTTFRERLTLHIGTTSFAGANATLSSTNALTNILTWSNSGLTWAANEMIAVRLTLSVPGIDSITFSDAGTDGAFAPGDAVTATVTFNEAVDVTGTPQLEIDVAGTPTTLSYSSGSGTTALVFTGYTVASGEEDTDGLAVAANKLTLNGGTIRATADGNPDAVLDHDAVPASANHRIDGVKPTLVTTGGGAPRRSSDGTRIILAFSEAIGAVDRTGITVKSGPTTLSTTADSTSGARVEITLTNALTSSDTAVTVELAAEAVTDVAGNGNEAVAATSVTITDDTAPTLAGASTPSNDVVLLSYDEALDSSSIPHESAFTVEVGGIVRPVSSVATSGDMGLALTLGLAFRPATR